MAKKAARPAALAAGIRVRTNAAFLRLFGAEAKPWCGRLIDEVSTMPGTWRVSVDGVAPAQWIHTKFLEVES